MSKEKLALTDLDDVIFLIGYINTFGGNILNLNQSLKACFRALQSIDRMKNLQDMATHQAVALTGEQEKLSQSLIYGFPAPEIEFKNVVFSYPNSIRPTLNGLSFKINPGTKVGIIGRSNAGKSTIVKLLYGTYRPQSGTITLNGHNINDIPPSVLSRIFCYVPQSSDLFRDQSLKYNVLYGSSREALLKSYLRGRHHKQQASLSQDYQAINVESMVDEAAKDYNYQEANKIFSAALQEAKLSSLDNRRADDKGGAMMLSGGQRQRLSLARALVRNSNIFILDEVTSGLDTFTENEVVRNIEKMTKHKTSLMISHRLSTVKNADEIIVIEEGRNVEQGSPNQLLEDQGIYYTYWQNQMH
jgi:ABC-type multidrug transport system fused ATPase/permease subunit